MRKIKISSYFRGMKPTYSFLFCLVICFWCSTISLVYSQVLNDSTGFFYEKATNPKMEDDLIKAYKYFSRHKEQSLKQCDTLSIVIDLRLLSNIQKDLGFLYDSELSIVEALKYLDNQSASSANIDAKLGLYNQMGMIYRDFYNYDKALEFYDIALEISKNSMDSVKIHNNKANIYRDKGQYELGVKELENVSKKEFSPKDFKQLARVLDNLGFIQSKIHIPEALPNMLKAMSIRLEGQDFVGLYSSYKHLSEYYELLDDKEEAIRYANEAYATAQRINSISFIEDALSLLMELDDNPNVVRFKKLKDSILKQKQQQENKYAQLQYDYTSFKQRALESEIQTEKEKSIKSLYKTIGIGVMLLSVSMFFIFRYKHKEEKTQQVFVTESRISKKVHDEVANNVFQVMTKLQGINSNNEVLDDLEDIYSRARDISKELSILDFDEKFEDSIEDLMLSFTNTNTNVIATGISKVEWNSISKIRKQTIYKVLQELFVNMKKHSNASVVLVSFDFERRKIMIGFSDNGIGSEIKKQTGLQNVENRIKAINGTIIFESETNKGFKVKMMV